MQFKRLCTIMCFGMSVMLAGCGGDSGSQTPSPSNKAAVRQKAVAADYSDTVQELYIAYFGRPADPAGLANFEAALLAANAPTDLPTLSTDYATNASFKSLIDSFGNSAESNTLYGGSTTGAFVTQIFQNVLGRAPASAGLSYWTNAIDNEGLSKGNAAAAIMAGALKNTTAAGLVDAQTIANKVSVAGNFTAALSADPGVYKGQAAAASARDMLAKVTSTTVPSDFQSTVTSTIAVITAENSALPIDENSLSACPSGAFQTASSTYGCLAGTITGTTVASTDSCTLTIDANENITVTSGSKKVVLTPPYASQTYVKTLYYDPRISANNPLAFTMGLTIQSAYGVQPSYLFQMSLNTPTLETIENLGTGNANIANNFQVLAGVSGTAAECIFDLQ